MVRLDFCLANVYSANCANYSLMNIRSTFAMGLIMSSLVLIVEFFSGSIRYFVIVFFGSNEKM